MTLKIYTITKGMLIARKGMGTRNSCNVCNGIIKLGDTVVSKNNGRHSIRHKSCAKRVGLIE